MALQSTALASADIVRIESVYDFGDRDEVLGFLDLHPFLVPILIEASEIMPDYFPHGYALALDLSIDPEFPEDRVLFAFVRSRMRADEALDHLDWLDRGGWLDAAPRARGELVIDVDRL